jgi:hypothetical protein
MTLAMTHREGRLLLLLAASGLLQACGANPARPLDSFFPAQAGTILNGGLAESGDGFAPARPAAADPISAAAASLSERGGLRLELPRTAAAPVVFALPNGLKVELRQPGASGPGRLARGAVAYAAAGGTSYWSATAEGYEEWLLVENAGEGPGLSVGPHFTRVAWRAFRSSRWKNRSRRASAKGCSPFACRGPTQS